MRPAFMLFLPLLDRVIINTYYWSVACSRAQMLCASWRDQIRHRWFFLTRFMGCLNGLAWSPPCRLRVPPLLIWMLQTQDLYPANLRLLLQDLKNFHSETCHCSASVPEDLTLEEIVQQSLFLEREACVTVEMWHWWREEKLNCRGHLGSLSFTELQNWCCAYTTQRNCFYTRRFCSIFPKRRTKKAVVDRSTDEVPNISPLFSSWYLAAVHTGTIFFCA
jgi:hypothetical protein